MQHAPKRSLLAGGVALACLAVTARAPAAPPTYRLAFGTGAAPAGFTAVPPDAAFTEQRGFGFEGAPPLTAGDGYVTAGRPFYFSLAVPEGNYRVTVTLGDPAGTSDTTVKAELRRLMLRDVATAAGERVARPFIVNVRTPAYPGGRVALKGKREAVTEARAWDGKLTLEFNGARPCVDRVVVEPVDVPTLYLLGDSTVCDQPAEPYASWGQMLPALFIPDVAVANHAESGETLASSAGAHRFDKVLSLLRPGDVVLLQYGHNDMKSKAPDALPTYKATLKSWVEQVKAKGATPVLVTSMNRHSFDGDRVTNSLGGYPAAVREAAAEQRVALIDLNAMSEALYEALGPARSADLFAHPPGSAKFDHTHHSPYGAYELARCVALGLRLARLPIADHLADGALPFDPAKPEPASAVVVPPSPAVTSQKPLGD